MSPSARKNATFSLLLALGAMLLLSACGSDEPTEESIATTTAAKQVSATPEKPFSDFEFEPPKSEFTGPLFELSQDYPTQMPPESEIPGFYETDFHTDWRTYMMEVRDYCFEGNTEVDWRVQENKVRPWYHMPWQDYGPKGREGIHGLTREAAIKPEQLATTQKYGKGGAYAVGVYNSFGGYTIGQVWKDHEHPNREFVAKQGFPKGTVVCKLLFISIPPEVIEAEIPFLDNPIEWQAFTGVSFNGTQRAVHDLTLIQLDIMVRDERASAGWIFGTYQYNGKLKNPDRWQNLAPVGLMWGNDPNETANIPETENGKWPALKPPTETPVNPKLEETVINPNAEELPPTHLGWNGRLNGPVDNPLSSCMSCHMTASSPEKDLSPLFTGVNERPQAPGSEEWKKWWLQWFQNVGWKEGKLEGFMGAEYPLDYSLQLSDALQNFYEAEKDVTPKNPVQR